VAAQNAIHFCAQGCQRRAKRLRHAVTKVACRTDHAIAFTCQ
jgi:hypothetical protein